MPKSPQIFEKRFVGPSNLGLRKTIRDATEAAMPCCAGVMRATITGLGASLALTPLGLAKLTLVAEDYAKVRKSREPKCPCDACVAGGLQQLGALG